MMSQITKAKAVTRQSNHGISLVSDLAKVHDGTCHAKPVTAYLRKARCAMALEI